MNLLDLTLDSSNQNLQTLPLYCAVIPVKAGIQKKVPEFILNLPEGRE